MPYLGEFAALAAAFFWGSGAFLFENAGAKIGALPTNLLRLVMGCVLLGIAVKLTHGVFFPVHVSPYSLKMLMLSGLVGLALGDGALFYAIVILGPRLSTLLLSLAPPITALIARVFLHEELTKNAAIGIVVTVSAIVWVISEPGKQDELRGSKTIGVLLGLLAAFGQALGVVLAKRGLTPELDALSATLIRILPATLVMWIFAAVIRQVKPTLQALKNRRAMLTVFCGALLGPFIGVWLSIVSVKYTEAGVAATLMATVPVMIIPLEYIFYNRKPSWRGVIGTVTTVLGVALLFRR